MKTSSPGSLNNFRVPRWKKKKTLLKMGYPFFPRCQNIGSLSEMKHNVSHLHKEDSGHNSQVQRTCFNTGGLAEKRDNYYLWPASYFPHAWDVSSFPHACDVYLHRFFQGSNEVFPSQWNALGNLECRRNWKPKCSHLSVADPTLSLKASSQNGSPTPQNSHIHTQDPPTV